MASKNTTRSTPPALLALGRRALPGEIVIQGRQYVKRKVFKNDFFAVTALYEGDAGRVVLKLGREASFFCMPLSCVGRFLAAKEQAALQSLHDLEGIPRYMGRWGTTGIVREYIEGRTLKKGEPVPDDFHRRLRSLVDGLHARGMAYVDLEKCENVLLGDDGRPYLFDFQISWYLPARWGGELWLARLLRRWLQAGDRYHLLKLQRRTRPDQMTEELYHASYGKPWYIRLQGTLTRPLTLLRRVILRHVDPRRRIGERGRVNDEQTIGMTY